MSDQQATRYAYDIVAEDYEAMLRDDLAHAPMERAMLAAFAEQVCDQAAGPVVDIGCGPGRITAHLSTLGLDVSGIDLSPAMVAVARRQHPALSFTVGDLLHLTLPDGGLAAALAWYSLIHLPPQDLLRALAELHRVLRPGGLLLLAFQVGAGEPVALQRPYGHDVDLQAYRRDPQEMARLLGDAGLTVLSTCVCSPEPPQKAPRAYQLCRAR